MPLAGDIKYSSDRSIEYWKSKGLDRLFLHAHGLAFDFPESTTMYVKEHAQELADEVTREHIKTYVNDFTQHLGDEGRAAIERLEELAQAAGVLK